MSHILLLGADGQVGWELRRSLAALGRVSAYSRETADLQDLSGLTTLVERLQPTIIVNAAAYTAVDKAESDAEVAGAINAESVRVLAQLAAQHCAWLVHYSTDYVFDGQKPGRYQESDLCNPVSVYGRTKRDGEEAIIASGCRHLIFRTSWVYASRGNNFVKTILRLAAERDTLKVVADQVGAPTSAELIADVTALALYRLCNDPAFADSVSGVYHLTASGETSWHKYAEYVIAQAERFGRTFKVSSSQVEPIDTCDYPTPAKRPANSCLDTSKLERTLNVLMPHWKLHVDRLLTELKVV